jgi:hypothetical protein
MRVSRSDISVLEVHLHGRSAGVLTFVQFEAFGVYSIRFFTLYFRSAQAAVLCFQFTLRVTGALTNSASDWTTIKAVLMIVVIRLAAHDAAILKKISLTYNHVLMGHVLPLSLAIGFDDGRTC